MDFMNAIKKILNVKNNSITIKGLESFNNLKVEVIIIPVVKNEIKSDADKKALMKYCGIGSSCHSDTSRNVDKLIYG